jgi:hypothetical protein
MHFREGPGGRRMDLSLNFALSPPPAGRVRRPMRRVNGRADDAPLARSIEREKTVVSRRGRLRHGIVGPGS